MNKNLLAVSVVVLSMSAISLSYAQLSPQAQIVVDQSKVVPAVSKKDFIIAKAKEFLTAKNYQDAAYLSNYVITTLDSKSIDAKKIFSDATAALTKMAQDKIAKTQQNNPTANQAMTDMKNMLETK